MGSAAPPPRAAITPDLESDEEAETPAPPQFPLTVDEEEEQEGGEPEAPVEPESAPPPAECPPA